MLPMNKTVLVILGIAVLIVMLVGGFLPLPGSRDSPGAHTQPSRAGESPIPTSPSGPPTDSGVNPGQGK